MAAPARAAPRDRSCRTSAGRPVSASCPSAGRRACSASSAHSRDCGVAVRAQEDSTAWLKASSAPATVVGTGTVAVSSGSTRTTSARAPSVSRDSLRPSRYRVANRVSSLPEPAVVGTRTSRPGRFRPTRSGEPRQSAGSASWAASTEAALATSMLLPPPMPTTASGRSRRMTRTASSMWPSSGLGRTSPKWCTSYPVSYTHL